MVHDVNRFVLVVNDNIRTVNAELEDIRRLLQAQIGRIVLIEKVNFRRFLSAGILNVDYQRTDITFVVVNHQNRQFTLYENDADTLNLYVFVKLEFMNSLFSVLDKNETHILFYLSIISCLNEE